MINIYTQSAVEKEQTLVGQPRYTGYLKRFKRVSLYYCAI